MFEKNSFVRLRAPISVNLEVTERCNLSCSFCFNAAPQYVQLMESGKQRFAEESKIAEKNQARKERLMQIIDKLVEAQVFEVRFFGGEFTVFKHWREVMEYAYSRGLFISFVSNGYLFTEKDIEFLFNCGVRECNISVHGSEELHDRITNKPGSFKRAMESIALLKNKGITVSVAYTPNATNISYLSSFVQLLSKKYQVEHFGINRLFYDERYENLTLNNYMQLLQEIDKCHKEMGVNIYLIDSFPRCKVPIRYWQYLSYCSQGVGFAQINFNGDIKHCSAVSKKVGNILERDMSEIWDVELEEHRRLDHLPHSCKICPIFCGGGCTASRGVDNKFSPDEFIPWPTDESFGQALGKSIYNRGRRVIYDLFYKRKLLKTQQKVASERPKLSQRYKIRKEDENTYVAMFERGGVKILSPLAVEVLNSMTGTNSIEDIQSRCANVGYACSLEEVREVALSVA